MKEPFLIGSPFYSNIFPLIFKYLVSYKIYEYYKIYSSLYSWGIKKDNMNSNNKVITIKILPIERAKISMKSIFEIIMKHINNY